VRFLKNKIVIIDEIQKIPELLPVVHQLIEQKKGIQFILTGSSSRKLKRTGVDLLAGRALNKSLHPFMPSEISSLFSLEKALEMGMLPLVWDSPEASSVLESYIALYMHEEVKAESLVRNAGDFARFLEIISFSHAAIINYSQIARESEIGRKTVVSYLNILEDLLLAFRLPVFTKKAKRHLIQHEKFYYFDCGVYRSIRPKGPLDRPEEINGAALEGLVAQSLRAWSSYSQGSYQLFFWRTKSGNEVDFILYGKDVFWAIEVKNAAVIRSNDLNGLRSFCQDYPNVKPILLYRGSDALKKDNIFIMPCDRFLKELRPNEDPLQR
jgi:predicted AAA+ superfamily ATPase